MAPQVCPNCGADVPSNAKACPECGSDDETGWSDAAETEGLDLPDEKFDYADFVSREFSGQQPKPHGIAWLWWTVAIVVLAAMLLMFLRIR